MTALVMACAWAVEAAFGWPDALYKRIRHPVVWIGALITALERGLNAEDQSDTWRLVAGAVTTLSIATGVWALAAMLVHALPNNALGLLAQALVASGLLASRSLQTHVAAVATPLSTGAVDEARSAVAKIVGRDPATLDDAGIARAALESLAENTSDGVIAPLFWGVILGLPGLAAYKAINTLDSMIGHRNARYEYFGKAAARLDDAVNWIPARLTAALFALAGPSPGTTWRITGRDASRHRSINAGWPEAAMAGALNVRLSGPRRYGDTVSDEPWLNADASDPDAATLKAGLALYRQALHMAAVLVIVLAVIEVGA